MEICDKFKCINKHNKECRVPITVVSFVCPHVKAPCIKASCSNCVTDCERNKNNKV